MARTARPRAGWARRCTASSSRFAASSRYPSASPRADHSSRSSRAHAVHSGAWPISRRPSTRSSQGTTVRRCSSRRGCRPVGREPSSRSCTATPSTRVAMRTPANSSPHEDTPRTRSTCAGTGARPARGRSSARSGNMWRTYGSSSRASANAIRACRYSSSDTAWAAGIVTLAAIVDPPAVDGILLSGAALGADVPAPMRPLVLALGRIAPNLAITKLDSSTISRDPQVCERYDNDPLVFRGRIKAGLASAMMRSGARIRDGMSAIAYPLLIMHGTLDQLAPGRWKQGVVRAGVFRRQDAEALRRPVSRDPQRAGARSGDRGYGDLAR